MLPLSLSLCLSWLWAWSMALSLSVSLPMPLPSLLTIQSGINQLRYATLKGIMAAKKKRIRTVTGQAITMRHRVLSLYAPEKTKQTTMIDGTPEEVSRELVRLLREETDAI